MRTLWALAVFMLPAVELRAQSALSEPAEFPAVRPGPKATQAGWGCFHLASGTIVPGDVDWVQVTIPRATTQTVVDVDFAVTPGGSALLASIVNGSTAFNISDNNNTRDALCGLSSLTIPAGSTRDSAVSLNATIRNVVINVGVTGAEDTSFVGAHGQTFNYDVWLYAATVPCTQDTDCTDGLTCTADSCDLLTGTCLNEPDDSACDNGLFCDGVEYCDSMRGCQAETPPDCDDGVDCTNDQCDSALDRCVYEADDEFCDDGVFCNGGEFCHMTQGCLSGPPPACDDGVGCTADACDAALDACVHDADDALCDDGRFCNGAETCDAVNDCQSGAPPTCDDGVDCTADSCDAALDQCVFEAEDQRCDNGLFCDGPEWCDPAAGCQSGNAPSCDDGVECTADRCDPSGDACRHDPDDSVCDDGRFCNGDEVCDPRRGCQAGTAPSCDDGVACTVDACDDALDDCVSRPDDARCDDSVFCNGDEFCDVALGCQSGDDPCPGDLCREHDGQCVECLTDADCDDEAFCTGVESCDPSGVCLAGEPPCPADMACNAEERRCEGAGTWFTLDLKPGACPNRFTVMGNGYFLAAVTGAPGSDVRDIDVRSLRLARADGVGGSLPPSLQSPGPKPAFEDVAAPYAGEGCGCHDAISDGNLDLLVHFSMQAMTREMRLDQVPAGTIVTLRLTGRLADGSSFSLTDCVLVRVLRNGVQQ